MRTLLGVAFFSSAARAQLCTSSTTLSVCIDSSNGRISNLTDLIGSPGRSLLGPSTSLWYTEFLSDPPDVRDGGFSSDECAHVAVTGGGAAPLVATFSGCGANALDGQTATFVASVYADGSALKWNLSIPGVPANWSVSEVHFPEVNLWTPAAFDPVQPSSDRATHCTADGVLVVDPSRGAYLMDGDYPGACGMQLLSKYDDQSGMALYTDDTGANMKHFVAWSQPTAAEARVHYAHGHKLMGQRPGPGPGPAPGAAANASATATAGGNALAMYPYHLFPLTSGQATALPYSVVWQGYSPASWPGTWRGAADIYKAWALQQWWVAQAGTVSNTSRVPPWFVAGTALMMTQTQGPDGYDASVYGPHMEKLPGIAAAYTQLLHTNNSVMLPMGWEHDGCWAGIFYGPAQPDDADYASAVAAARDGGNYVGMMVSGYWWVTKRNTTEWGPAFNNTDRITSELIAQLNIAQDGTVWQEDFYNVTGASGEQWRGLSYRLCHGAPGVPDTMASIFNYASNTLNADFLSFDQEIGGGQVSPCYSRDHGHAIGVGHWMWQGLADTVAAIRAYHNASRPPLLLCTEQTGELLLPLIGTSHSYQTAVDGWPWGEVSGSGTGAFSYVYHAHMPIIGLPAGQAGNIDYPNTVLILRQNFVNALVRGLIQETGNYFVQPNGTGWPAPNPLQVGCTPAFAAYSQPYALFPDMLVRSDTVPPPAVTSTSVSTHYFPTPAACAGDPTLQASNGAFFPSALADLSGRPQAVLSHRHAGGIHYGAPRSADSNVPYFYPLCSVSVGGFSLADPTLSPSGAQQLGAVVASISDNSTSYSIHLDTWAGAVLGTGTGTGPSLRVSGVSLYAGNGTQLQSWPAMPTGAVTVGIDPISVHMWILQLAPTSTEQQQPE